MRIESLPNQEMHKRELIKICYIRILLFVMYIGLFNYV